MASEPAAPGKGEQEPLDEAQATGDNIRGEGEEDFEDDIPFDADSRGSGSFDEEGEEEDDDEIHSGDDDISEEFAPDVDEKDRLIHWWCQRQLARCLRKLRREEDAEPFLVPVPWQELELDDYLEVVKTPMDLKTVEDRVDSSQYDDKDGLVNPELFWNDVHLCWENCLTYYEDDEELEACAMARAMINITEKMEDDFFAELEVFEKNMDEVDATLGGVTAALDVAADALEEVAGVAYDSVAAWFSRVGQEDEAAKRAAEAAAKKRAKKLEFGRDDIKEFDADYDPEAAPSPLDYQFYRAAPPPLKDHFGDLLLLRYRYNAQQELQNLELQITTSINAACKVVDERDEEVDFDGSRQKIPLTRLFPGLTKASRAKQKASPASPKTTRKGSSRQSTKSNTSSASAKSKGGGPTRHGARHADNTSDATSPSSNTSSRSSSRRRKSWSRSGRTRSNSTVSAASSRSLASIASASSAKPRKQASSASQVSGASSLGKLSADPRIKALLMGEDSDSDKEKDKKESADSMGLGKLKTIMQKRKKRAEIT